MNLPELRQATLSLRDADPDSGRRLAMAGEEALPEFFRAVYPRRYVNTPGFGSARITAGYLALAMSNMSQIAPPELPTAYKLLMPILWHMIPKRMPWLFIAPQLAEAVKRTTFLDEIDWTRLCLPYEKGGMLLPPGTLTHPVDGDCCALFWGRLEPGDVDPPRSLASWPFPHYTLANKAFSIVALCPKTGMWYDSNLTDAKRPVLKLNNLFYTEGGIAPTFEKNELTILCDHDLNEENDRAFVEQMGVLIFGTFLAFSARPDLLEGEKLERTVRDKKHGGTREFWSPNIIGRHYRLPSRRPDQGGTHASPRMHWRRGHFRNQACGPQNRERKTVWLEPMLVGAE